jgi:L-ascorbate metabolism protein UlaG (beta-lactamase superfamily)
VNKSRPARRLVIEGLESRWALAGNSVADVGDAAAEVVVQSSAVTRHAVATHLEASRISTSMAGLPHRAAPVLRATAIRRAAEPRGSSREGSLPAQAPEAGVPVRDRGDFNSDLVVDRGDVAVLASHLALKPATFADGDLNADGDVSLFDLSGMIFSSPALDVVMTSNVTNVDNAGDIINYTYTVANTGNSTLTGVTLTDDQDLVPVRQADTFGDNDDLLEFGETWRYTVSYTVVGADLAEGLDLVNVATADSDQTAADTDDAVVHNLFTIPQITIGDVTIRSVTHASFVMTWNGLTIYSDPDGAASLYNGLPRADLILVTHNHGDHFDATTINGVADTDVRLITPQNVYNSLSAARQSATTVLTNGTNTDLLGLNVAAVPAYNGNHPLGVGNAYVVTLGDQRIFISGDTGPVPEIRDLTDIDVAFLCMNVPFTMNVTEGISVTRDMVPQYVIPYHYRNQNGTFADLNAFKTGVGRDLGINVRLLDWY